MPSLPQRWAMASPSSCPVCLASALPSFLTSLSAHGCQPPKGLCHQGEEGAPLLPTVLFSSPELAVMGKVEGMTGLRGCPHHCGVLEGVDHRHAKGSISSPCPERHQDIRWALCLLILSPPVPQQRAWSPMTSLRRRQAGHWAGTLGIVDWQPQPVLDCQNKL